MKFAKVALLLLAIASGGVATAQQDLEHYIKTSPLLTQEQRERAAGWMQEAQAQGDGGGKKRLNSCTVATSPISSISIKLFPMLNGTPLIVVLDRIESPTEDAQIRAYSSAWEELPTLRLFAQPPTRELLLERWGLQDAFAAQRIAQLLRPLHLQMKWVPGVEDQLSVRAVLPLSLSDREQTSLMEAADLSPELIYRWDGATFQLLPNVRTKDN